MQINKMLLSALVVILLTLSNVSGIAQVGKMNLQSTRSDTISVYFLDQFNYDVVIVFINGIEVYNSILYSKSETGNAYKGFKIFLTVKEIVLDVVLYERNQKFSLEYNALWYNWDIDTDPAFYYSPVKETRVISPDIDGKKVYVSLEKNENPNGEIRKAPVILVTNRPILLD
jgi:hypothetical protein